MWEDSNYCWVVLCKNRWFHMRKNLFFRHRIPLAETDPVAPLPSLPKRFTVRCDECRKTYIYEPKDVLRAELELPESFKPHPLFREDAEDDTPHSNRVTAQEVRQAQRPKDEPSQKEPPKKESSQDESPQSERPPDGQARAKGA